MATGLEIMLKLSADNRDLKAKLDEANAKLKEMSGPSSPLGKLKSMFSAANVAIMGVVGVIGFFASRIMGMAQSAMAAERQQTQLNAVLQSTQHIAGLTAGEVNRIATELAGATAASRGTILSGQTMLLTFTNIGRDVFPAATEALLDMTTVMTQGNVTQEAMSSGAVRLGRALNDPITGMTALRRVGVAFTDQQELQIKAMVRAGDVMGAQRVILSELGREFGGSARAFGNTTAGQIQRLENAMAGLRRETGEKLLPGIGNLARALTDFVKSGSAFSDSSKGMAQDVSTLLTGISGLIQIFNSLSSNNSSSSWAKNFASNMNLVTASWNYTIWAIEKFNELMGNTDSQRMTAALSAQDRLSQELIKKYGSIDAALTHTGDAGVQAYRRITAEVEALRNRMNNVQGQARVAADMFESSFARMRRQGNISGGPTEEEIKAWNNKVKQLTDNLQSSWQQYYQFLGDQERADTAQMQSNYDKQKQQFSDLLRYRIIDRQTYNQALIGLEAARFRQEEELAIKHNIMLRTIQEDWLKGFQSAYSSFESATKAALQETLTGENGWDAWQKSMKKILQQLVVDLGYAIAKAMLLQTVSAAIGGPTGVGDGFIGGMIKKAFFKDGYIPSFAKGRIPVLANGMMPADHFPAYIGTREAVINAESTRANLPLLAAMNANPGASMGGGGDINVTVNAEVDGEVLFRVNEKRRQERATALGMQNYGRRSVYR